MLRGVLACSVFLAIAGAASACSPPGRAEFSGQPVVQDDTLLRFPGGGEFASGLYSVGYVGQLPASTKAPFIVLEGIECTDCDAPSAVLMRSPSDGRIRSFRNLPGWYAYPGRVVDLDDTTKVLVESRLFWGECLEGRLAGLVQYATEFTAGTAAPQLLRTTEIRRDSLVTSEQMARPADLESTLNLVAEGRCREIPPRHRLSDP